MSIVTGLEMTNMYLHSNLVIFKSKQEKYEITAITFTFQSGDIQMS